MSMRFVSLCVCVFLCTCGVCVTSSVRLLYTALTCGLSVRGDAACFSVHVTFGHRVHSSSPRPHSGWCPVRCPRIYQNALLQARAAGVSVCVCGYSLEVSACVHSYCSLTIHVNGTVYWGMLCVTRGESVCGNSFHERRCSSRHVHDACPCASVHVLGDWGLLRVCP